MCLKMFSASGKRYCRDAQGGQQKHEDLEAATAAIISAKDTFDNLTDDTTFVDESDRILLKLQA